MKVKDVMTVEVDLVRPTQTIRQAALLMGKGDCGALPVADKDSLVGMITIGTSQSGLLRLGKAKDACARGNE